MTEGLAGVGRFGFFLARAFRACALHPPSWARLLEEMYRIGVRSLPILLIISTFVGTNLALQGYSAFEPLGGQSLIGMFVALAGVREMAPIMVAAMVASKAGTEMASQIAVMRIRDQIDALEVMAIDPYGYLIVPRLLGILLTIPALSVMSTFTLIGAAWVVATVQLNLNGHEFLSLVVQNTRPLDLAFTMVKSLVFGAVICLVSCWYGFTSRPGPAGVGRATNLAVVVSAVTCALLNYLLSEVFYG